jgi:hypothetical protein
MADDFTGTNTDKIDKLVSAVVEIKTTLRDIEKAAGAVKWLLGIVIAAQISFGTYIASELVTLKIDSAKTYERLQQLADAAREAKAHPQVAVAAAPPANPAPAPDLAALREDMRADRRSVERILTAFEKRLAEVAADGKATEIALGAFGKRLDEANQKVTRLFWAQMATQSDAKAAAILSRAASGEGTGPQGGANQGPGPKGDRGPKGAALPLQVAPMPDVNEPTPSPGAPPNTPNTGAAPAPEERAPKPKV